MRAILWKEIRENVKWAILWMLAVGAVMAYTMYEAARPYNWGAGQTLVGPFQVITIIGTALGASLLGLVQTVPERRRDQWAFLVHRPITRTEIFFGKAIAGLGLYGAAMLVPLLVAVGWAAVPGHMAAPFSWRMVLPGTADVLGGAAFYFAAMLTGIRQARWYGSRALPFVLAIVCAALVLGAWEFWQAVLAVVVCAGVLMAAAWGSFLASGQYRSQPTIAKAALGVVLLVGVLGVGLVGGTLVASVVEQTGSGPWTRYYVDKQGRVLRVSTAGYGQYIHSITDLAGNPVDTGKSPVLWDFTRKSLLQFSTIRQGWRDVHGPGYRNSQRFFMVLDNSLPESWYFVPGERLFVGYDRQTRRAMGTLGPAGFSPAGTTPAERFPDARMLNPTGYQPWLIPFELGVYEVDIAGRRVRLLQAATRQDPILGTGRLPTNDTWPPVGPVAIVTADRIDLLSETGQPLFSFAPHYPLARYGYIQAAVKPEGGYVIWYAGSFAYHDDPDSSVPGAARDEYVVELSAGGQELHRYDLPPIDRPNPAPTWPHVLWALVIPIACLVGFAAFMLTYTWIWYGYPAVAMELWQMRVEVFGAHMAFWMAAGAVLLGGAIVWALLVFGIARRYEFTRRQSKWWSVAGFFFGPAGLLTLMVLREWPARAECGSCGAMRLVDREGCGHCGSGWAPRAPAGTEIFDEAGAREAVAADR